MNSEPSLDQMIDQLVEAMDDWDTETIVQWAQNTYRDILEQRTPESIREKWHDTFIW